MVEVARKSRRGRKKKVCNKCKNKLYGNEKECPTCIGLKNGTLVKVAGKVLPVTDPRIGIKIRKSRDEKGRLIISSGRYYLKKEA